MYEAYFLYGIEDLEEESPELEKEEKFYWKVVDNFYDSLQLYADYEESYEI